MMPTEQELKDLIIQKLDKLDRKIDDGTKDLKNEIALNTSELNNKINLVKNDLTWLKWLFGIFSSLIIVLLSVLLTVTFKLLGA